ncbi:MAG: hypothetical protein H0W50_05725 [Parachlamydiaceae bacterium]|nr:hypothetical protein [Parachlamydiaceae bacterium]
MNVVEFIGFIAMMLFLLHSARNKRQSQQGQSDEIESEEMEQAQRLKEFLQGIDSDMKPTPVAKQQPRAPLALRPQKEVPKWEHSSAKQPQKNGKEKPLKSHVQTPYLSEKDPYKDPYAVKKDAYAIAEKRKSGAFYLKKRLKASQDMILWQEIMSPPVGMRDKKH